MLPKKKIEGKKYEESQITNLESVELSKRATWAILGHGAKPKKNLLKYGLE